MKTGKNKKKECQRCRGRGKIFSASPRTIVICNECGGNKYIEEDMITNKNHKTILTFDKLRKTNVSRCNIDIRALNSWTPLEWGGALAGETGELCNFLKKLRRGEKVDKKDMAYELADIITYADLLAAALDIDLGEAVIEKFNIVSKRWNSKYKL